MTEHKTHTSRRTRGELQTGGALSPNGTLMTLDDLPSPETKRWVIRRKAEVVAGVHGGLISLQQACRRYQLSVDEFRSWEALLKDHGLPGLRVTRTKKYRGRTKSRAKYSNEDGKNPLKNPLNSSSPPPCSLGGQKKNRPR